VRVFWLSLAVGAASFSLVNALACVALLAARRLAVRPAAGDVLLAWRVAPALVSLAVAFGLVVPAFVALEPAGIEEPIGPVLLGAAAAGVWLLMAGLTRGWTAWRATRRLGHSWMRASRPLDLAIGSLPVRELATGVPIAAVIGWRRPQVFVSRGILDACTADELLAILAHEAAHASARDNVKRWLIAALPDWCAGTPIGRRLDREWVRAVESAADGRASSGGARQGLDLASALLKVARLAPEGVRLAAPVVTLHDGGDLAPRVERLAQGTATAVPAPAGSWWVGAAAIVMAIPAAGLSPAVQHTVYQWAEDLVRLFG
jgi:hypothetical protein